MNSTALPHYLLHDINGRRLQPHRDGALGQGYTVDDGSAILRHLDQTEAAVAVCPLVCWLASLSPSSAALVDRWLAEHPHALLTAAAATDRHGRITSEEPLDTLCPAVSSVAEILDAIASEEAALPENCHVARIALDGGAGHIEIMGQPLGWTAADLVYELDDAAHNSLT